MDIKEYNIVISEDALAMLDRHAAFLAYVSRAAAEKMADQILDDIDSLSKLPERCPFYDNQFIPVKRYRKLLSGKRYLILYEILGDTVYIDYILDGRQDIGETL